MSTLCQDRVAAQLLYRLWGPDSLPVATGKNKGQGSLSQTLMGVFLKMTRWSVSKGYRRELCSEEEKLLRLHHVLAHQLYLQATFCTDSRLEGWIST